MADSRPRRTGPAAGLRTAAVWSTLAEVTRERGAALGRPLRVLDIGGGSGGMAVPLAETGQEVTVLDPSPDALASLGRRARECGVQGRVSGIQGDTDSLSCVLGEAAPFDLICLHGTLELADDPEATIAAVSALLADGGVLSLVVAQRLSAVLGRALAGEFDKAAAVLSRPDGRWGEDDPGPRRYDREAVVALLTRHGLTVRTWHGVRIFSDHVPSALLDSDADRAALLDLEHLASHDVDQPLLAALGATVHVLATL